MKEKYVAPEMEMIYFDSEDVIRTSNVDETELDKWQ